MFLWTTVRAAPFVVPKSIERPAREDEVQPPKKGTDEACSEPNAPHVYVGSTVLLVRNGIGWPEWTQGGPPVSKTTTVRESTRHQDWPFESCVFQGRRRVSRCVHSQYVDFYDMAVLLDRDYAGMLVLRMWRADCCRGGTNGWGIRRGSTMQPAVTTLPVDK